MSNTPKMNHDGSFVRVGGYLRRPHVKLVYPKPTLLEAIKFEGGHENAKQIVEWVRIRGGDAEYVTNGLPTHSRSVLNKNDPDEYVAIRITTPEYVSIPAFPGRWVVLHTSGIYEQMTADVFEHMFVMPEVG